MLYEGYLAKRGKFNKQWKRRYCQLFADGKVGVVLWKYVASQQ